LLFESAQARRLYVQPLALSEYCELSVRHIFDATDGVGDTILSALRQAPDGLTHA
jgi:hypothetical protein